MRILKLEQLAHLGACLEHRDRFRKVFGEQAEVTVERFSQPDVIDAAFDFDWAADCLLSIEGREAFYQEVYKRKVALKEQYNVHWFTDVPRERRHEMFAKTWAEFYVKEDPTLASVEVISGPVTEEVVTEKTTVEETSDGSR